MNKNMETNDTENEKLASRTEEAAHEKERRFKARYQTEAHDETAGQGEMKNLKNAQPNRTHRLTSDELAKVKIESATKDNTHLAQDKTEKNPAAEALLRKLNETPESERRAWEKAQFEGVRRLTPDELAKIKLHEPKEANVEKLSEQTRLDMAVESFKKMDDLKPERWRELSPERRKIALEHAGKALRDAYECPDPPLMPRDFPEYDGSVLLGVYRDGASIDNLKGDYDLSLNEQLLHNDDPRHALDAYCHEFRHAYQSEMASRYDKGQFRNMVHDTEAAARWSENFRDYKNPSKEFDQYREQIVEKDAREFSEHLVRNVYE